MQSDLKLAEKYMTVKIRKITIIVKNIQFASNVQRNKEYQLTIKTNLHQDHRQ